MKLVSTRPGIFVALVFGLLAAGFASKGLAQEPPHIENPDPLILTRPADPTTDARQLSRSDRDWQNRWAPDKPAFPFTVRTWQSADGLPDDRINAITQTRDGYLWVGTGRGVARFDGVHFTFFDVEKVLGMGSSYITSLCTDQEGTLWIGSDGGGLGRVSGNSISHFTQSNGLAADSVMAICEGHDGSIWIGTTNGVSHFQGGKFSNFGEKDGLSSRAVTSLKEDREGNVWIATDNGLNRLKGNAVEHFNQSNGLPKEVIRDMYEDRHGKFWLGSDNGLVLRHNQGFYTYTTRFGLSDSIVSAVCEDDDGNLLAGTFGGLNRFRNGQFMSELNNERRPFGRINFIFKDRDGTVWLGTQEGLSRLTQKWFSDLTKEQGLAHDNVMSVMEDRKGTMWVGTWGGGLNQLQDDKISAYTTANGLGNNFCLSTYEARDGGLWVGADFDGGMARIKDGQVTRYTWQDGLLKAAVRVFQEDQSGKLWIGTSQGLSCLAGGKFVNYTVKETLPGNIVRALCEDHAGNLWIGTDGGLSRRQNGVFNNFTTSNGLSDDMILALHEDEEKSLWIGTANGGLNRFKDGRFTAYTTREGLFSDEVYEILEDHRGWLWMSCAKGIFRVRKQDLDDLARGKRTDITSVAYGKADGMETTLCSGVSKPAGWKSRDGRLWFSTSKGLVSFNPDSIKINQTPPPVYIEQMLSTGGRPGDADTSIWNAALPRTLNTSNSPSASSAVKVPAGRGEVEFRYTALELERPEKIVFQCKLDGVDREWTQASTRRSVSYSDLSPGNYLFHVIARNSDGIWNQAGASLAIVILPHFWQTWVFKVLLALITGTAAVVAVRFIVWKKLNLQLATLAEQNSLEKERSRIAQDMHDDLGARLSEIVLHGNLATQNNASPEHIRQLAEKMTGTARELVDSLDEIVWAVNPKNDSLEKFADYVCEYLQAYLDMTSIKYSLDVPDKMPVCTLSSEARHNLYLVIKEALHNIVKHSSASHVRFRMQVLDSILSVSIEDDGKGFVPEDRVSAGNGLENMESRIRRIGGDFRLSALAGKGTLIHFQVPLREQEKVI